MDNIRRDIEEMMNLGSVNAKDVFRRCVPLTTANLGNVFNMSFMTEKKLQADAGERQSFVEETAMKRGCHVSCRLVYTTKGRSEELLDVRNELSGVMYVTPVFWIPIRKNWRTFGFGFFPYCEKEPFRYDPEASLSEINVDDRIAGFDRSTEMLHKMISVSIKEDSCYTIRLWRDLWDNKAEVYYTLHRNDDKELVNDDKYISGMFPSEYLNAVVSDYEIDDLVIPEYKMIAYRREELRYLSENDIRMFDKLNAVRSLLGKHISITDSTDIIYNGKRYLYFHYDDTAFDDLNRYFEFFKIGGFDI